MPAHAPVPLRRELARITQAGCLAMVYITFTNNAVFVEFFRELGATDLQFGLLGGLPVAMLVCQFFGAYLCGRIRRRKPWCIGLFCVARLMYIPVAVIPFFWGPSSPGLVLFLIFLLALHAGLTNMAVPVWFSWMGDVIPRRILNRYWGARHRFMTVVWTAGYLVVGGAAYLGAGVPARYLFLGLAVGGTAAGIADILLFLSIREPENLLSDCRNPFRILLEPLRHREYMSLIAVTCAFSFAAMFAAAFMQVFCLEVLGMSVAAVMLAWSTVGLGSAVFARTWGYVADHFGHRPVIALCLVFKPLVCVAFLILTPGNALPLLLVVFFLDSILNAGYEIAVNGYMLSMAPRQNRSMFNAALSSLAGIAGGTGAIAGGVVLGAFETWQAGWFGREWNHYHLVFAISVVLRIGCIPLGFLVREPTSASALRVASYLRGVWPLRMFLFPVGLYRRGSRKD